MLIKPNLREAIAKAWESLLSTGSIHKAKNWQGVKAPQPMIEKLWVTFQAPMPFTEREAIRMIEPNLPWANEHFKERVGGVPLNPPPSHEIWPFNQNGNKEFIKNETFDHTYPERFWPKKAGIELQHDLRRKVQRGIRFDYGDLSDVLAKLKEDTETRQAFFPIWFPEDTGKPANVRVPCSIGYHLLVRGDRLHITYWMRSVDMIRHFQDDVYLCWKLAKYVATELDLTLGYMVFQGVSCHIFESDVDALKYKLEKWKKKDPQENT